MAGGGIGSFIGPVHRMAAGLDASATLAAKLENGVLTVTMKKRAETQPKKIEIG